MQFSSLLSPNDHYKAPPWFVGGKIWPGEQLDGGQGKQRLPFNLYCKFGGRIALPEVLATVFVSVNTTIPVPRILDVVYEGNDLFVLMTRVPGIPADTDAALRSLAPATDVVGSFLQTSNLQRRIDIKHLVGPWPNIAAFHRFLVTQCPEGEGSDVYEEFRRVAPAKLFNKNHRLCFTHGDLAMHNFLIQDGRLSGLVDFECSGWFPEYWEYTGAITFKIEDRWKQAIRNVFGETYAEELEVEYLFLEANDGNF
ncbi:kinase-like domain-containing protein [Gymnopilus junonius]|uniref:Kinase-like domain-containing protein n=1 Tax=Gymnopilus junonius TaxID=109634 RepID=A0A9P5NBP3_GYMJU|nr:kinase-like domain-containing protein [Gymnopilus junonius]